MAFHLTGQLFIVKYYHNSPLAQLVERVAVKGSYRGKPRLELRANSGKPPTTFIFSNATSKVVGGNPELNSRDLRDKCAETIYPPPTAKATEKR